MERISAVKEKEIAVDQAVRQWEEVLGSEWVYKSPDLPVHYCRDLGLKSVSPLAVILPQNSMELQACVQIAARNGVPLHTFSRGKNWGYGGGCPISPDCVVCDLSRMNKILEVNTELAYAVVEPGVTQQQLYDYLQQRQIPLVMDVTGASPESSLIGNLSERGYGQTPYGDRFQYSSNFEVLLGDGTFIKTGFGHYGDSKGENLYKWGLGPTLDGIFTQSNFGVITKATIWLSPRPESTSLMLLQFDSDAQLVQTLPILRDLKLRGLLPSAVHISNEMRVVSCFARYPFDKLDGREPMPVEIKRKILKDYGVTPWTCFTSLRGSGPTVRSAARDIKKRLRGRCRIQIVSEHTLGYLLRIRPLLMKVFSLDPLKLQMLFNLVNGKPTFGPTNGAYWRKRSAPSSNPPDPVRDRCGVSWFAPIVPTTSEDGAKFLRIVRNVMTQFGFETNLTLTLLSDRALCCTVGIFYDADSSAEVARAKECYLVCLSECVSSGFYPYRHGINPEAARDTLFNPSDPFWQFCGRLKDVCDPAHILSPGKYGIV